MQAVKAATGREAGWPCRIAGLLLAIMVMSGSVAARAQVLYGSLTGNVTDASGAALPGAQVTARSVQTGDRSTQTSDSAGIYRFS